MNADAPLKELLREGDPGARVSPFALRRVEARLLEAKPRRFSRRYTKVAWVAALALGLPAAFAAILQLPQRFASAPPPAPAPAPVHKAKSLPAPPLVEAEKPPALDVLPPPVHPVGHRHVTPVSPSAPPAATGGALPEPSALSRETALLSRAIGHPPDEALRALDEYDAAFPHGLLAGEARLERVNALLALNQRPAALALLEKMSLEAGAPRGEELRLLRGELLAEAGRCVDAMPDLSAAYPGSLAERALYGHALCRIRLGDEPGGRQELEQYRSRYPHGRFAADVARTLQP